MNKYCVHCGEEIDFDFFKKKPISDCDNVKICSECLNDCMREDIQYDDFSERFVIQENITGECRIIVVLINNVVMKNHKKMREIVGLDVLTGGIVKLVDENGKRFSCHTDNVDVSGLKVMDVISVPLKQVYDAKEINTWRIVGKCEMIGKTNLNRLREKYRRTYWFDICADFETIFRLTKKTKNQAKSFYCLVRFTGAPMKKFNNNYWMKMGANKAKLDDNIKNRPESDTCMYRGIALVYVSAGAHRTPMYIAKHLYSDCVDILTNHSVCTNNKNTFYSDTSTSQEEMNLYYQYVDDVAKNITYEDVQRFNEELKSKTDDTSKTVSKGGLRKLLNKKQVIRKWTI